MTRWAALGRVRQGQLTGTVSFIPLISYLYVRIVKRVAQGLSREDGEELARGLYCIRPHERFTTHLLGSAWLCYAVMLAWFWTPIALDVLLEQSPAPFQVWDYERQLANGATVNALNVWKVCARNTGIVRALAVKPPDVGDAAEESASDWRWQALAASIGVACLLYDLWHLGGQHTAGVSTATLFNFYLIGGGTGSADINAGSSIGAAPNAAATGGSWTNATNTFVATGGTPFAGATANVDFVSVYPDGNTVTGYTARITTVVSNVSVILDATVKYGTAPTDGATNRSAVLGGSWNTEQVLMAGGLGTTTVPVATKINIKQATYTITASRTSTLAGSAALVLWFSGYNTTPGDLDADTTNSLSKPVFALNSSFQLTIGGTSAMVSSLSVTGSRTATILSVTSASAPVFVRVRSDNSNANAAAIGGTFSTAGSVVAYCWFRVPTTATTTGTVSIGSNVRFIGTIAENGGIAGFNAVATTASFLFCLCLTNTGSGILCTTGVIQVYNTTVYAATVDGVKWSGTPGSGIVVSGCLFAGLDGGTATTNGINTNGANIQIFRSNNDYYNVTNPEVGLGDSFAFFPQTDSAFPLTSSTDMTPLTSANAYLNGFPKVFEGGGAVGSQTNGGISIGAVAPTPTAGSSGVSGVIGDGSTW